MSITQETKLKMKPSPKVSVIVPVFNSGKFLEVCLDSILEQTLTEIEVICVDDGSTDDSLSILECYRKNDPRVKILMQNHQFAGAARNLGIDKSSGNYLIFLDSDDFFVERMLEQMYEQAVSDDSDIVVCNFSEYDNQSRCDNYKYKFKNRFIRMSPILPVSIKHDLFQLSNPAPWNKLFKAELVKKHQVRFENTRSANDVTFVYTAFALAKKISILDKPFVHYRINHGSNITANRAKSIDCILIAMNRLQENLHKYHLFSHYSQSFYKRVRDSIEYELSNVSRWRKVRFLLLAKYKTSSDIYTKVIRPLLKAYCIHVLRKIWDYMFKF